MQKKYDAEIKSLEAELMGVTDEKRSTEIKEQMAKLGDLNDYEEYLQPVLDLQETTRKTTFRELWKRLNEMESNAEEALITEDKSRPMIRHQETIRIIRDLRSTLAEPVRELNAFARDHPLLAADLRTLAEWRNETGTVEIIHR